MNAAIAEQSFENGDRLIPADAGGWRDAGPGIQVRVLRTCQVTGTWVALYKVAAGTYAAPHIHYGAAESYVISGKMEVRGGVEKGGMTVAAGDYSYEANGARHDATFFPEDTLLYYTNFGPIVYLDDQGEVDFIMDFNMMRKIGQ
jgi:quercetin dioxygenase-like cupin family protein